MGWSFYMGSKYEDRAISTELHSLYQMGSLTDVIESVSECLQDEVEDRLRQRVVEYARAFAELGITNDHVELHFIDETHMAGFLVPQYLHGEVKILCVTGRLLVATQARGTAVQTDIEKAQVLSIPTKHKGLPTRTLITTESSRAYFYVIGSSRTRHIDF